MRRNKVVVAQEHISVFRRMHVLVPKEAGVQLPDRVESGCLAVLEAVVEGLAWIRFVWIFGSYKADLSGL